MSKTTYIVTSRKITETITYKCTKCKSVNGARMTRSNQVFTCTACGEKNEMVKQVPGILSLGEVVE